jgi:hypothetical protein
MIDIGTLLGGGVAVAVIELLREIITRLIDRFGKKKSVIEKRIEALELGQRAVLRDRIRFLCRVYIAAGEISYIDREDLLVMHEAYHRLGGNGNLDAEMGAVMKLKCV